MLFNVLIAIFSCLGFGLLSSGGIFTVFVTVGLVPRLADKTHTAENILFYENCIIGGTIIGCLFSVLPWKLERYLLFFTPAQFLLTIFGLFSGIFIGCFAIAIAEMLNTIPIFSRRIALGKGMGIVLLFLAFGKTVGALCYFLFFS